jgi:O-antigen/teichoic acid export membrane protein
MLEGEETGAGSGRRSAGLARSALWTYGTNIAVAVLSLGNVLVVSRVLGPEGRGNVAFLTTVAFLTSNVAMFGVQEANANIAAKREAERPALATNSVVLAAVLGALAGGAVFALVHLFPTAAGDNDEAAIWLALVTLPVLVLHDYLEYMVRAEYAFRVANAAWLCAPTVNVVVNTVLGLTGHLTVVRAFATWAAGWLLSTLLLAAHVGLRSSGFGRPSAALGREAFVFGVKTHAGRVMTLGNYRFDQWLLGAMAGARQLGLYSVAVAWSEMLFFLPTALVLAQRPHLVRASDRDAVPQAARIFRVGLVATVALAVAVVLAAPILCVTIFGESFRGSIEQLRILAPGALGIVALKQLSSALVARGRPLHAALGTAAAFVLTLVLDVVLIPRFGAVGAAVASTAAYTVGGIVVVIVFVRVFRAGLRDLLPRSGDVPSLARLLTR